MFMKRTKKAGSQKFKVSRVLLQLGFMLYAVATTPHVFAQAQDPLKATISFEADKQPLEKILKKIASATDVKFAYDVNEIKKFSVTLRDKKEITIDDLLKKVLQQTGLVYESHANTIVIFSSSDAKPVSDKTTVGNYFSFANYQSVKLTVTGKVLDENGPLQNVSIVIKGTNSGTQTDDKGYFKLETDDKAVAVVVSFVGYQTKEITLKADADNVIHLEQSDMQLEKVVVVGYGSQKRSSITGAVADVKLDKVSSRSVNNVAEVLQGKAPGVIVANEGGDPTVSPRVYIRGMGGINGESALYVVDGAIFPGQPVVNPNDIESISVLKDASAAIYGARASGGVILITTKKGKAGTASVTFDAKYGVQSAWRKLYPLNAKEYADVMNLAADNAGKPRLDAFNGSIYPDGQITRTNWMDDIFRNAKINDYNVNINGGNDKSKYFMGFGYRKGEGILLNTYAERYNFRLNSEHQIKPWLKVGENMQYSYTNGNGANTGSAYTGAILSAIFYPPSVAPYNQDGTYAGLPALYAGAYGDVINPVAYLNRLDYKNPVNNLFINPYAEIKVLNNLTFRSNFALTKSFNTSKEFVSRVLEIGKIFDYNQLSQSSGNLTDILAEQTLNYNKKFVDHNFSALAGYTYQHTESEGFYVYAQNFNDERAAYRYFQNANDIFKPSGLKTESALISYLGRINYDYAGKYLLSLLARRDGTSLVAEKNRFENYGSVSGGWLISKEAFMSHINWLSNLKLRASYGILGNLGSIPVNAVNVPLSATAAYFGQSPAIVYGYAENALSNPNLKWAKSKQTNFGLDAGLFNNRLSLVADYFIKTTEDMLLQTVPPSTAGVSGGKWENVGEAQDKGVELGINYNSNPKSAFQYSVGATLTKVSNKLIALKEGITTISTTNINIRSTLTPVLIQTGSPLYSYYVVPTAGIFKSQEEVSSYTNKSGSLIQPNAVAGDLKFVDTNGDGIISNDDRVVKGSAYPDFSYGFSFNASYKNFDLNLFVQGVQGNKLFNGLKYMSLQAGVSGQNYNMLEDIRNAWSPTNVNASIPRVSLSDPNGNFSTTSDWFIEDGSYARIKNVTLGYTLPAMITNRIHINSLRVCITANNLLTITNYSGFDPEVGMDNYGIDIGRYPQARTVLFGVNVNF